MSGSITNPTFPLPTTPVVGTQIFNRTWYDFLLYIYQRTGGSTPFNPAALQAEIEALQQAVANLMAAAAVQTSVPILQANSDPQLALALAAPYVPRLPYGVGQFESSTVLSGAAVSLSNGVSANVTSLTLPPGTWDCEGNIAFTAGSGTVVDGYSAWINNASATQPTLPGAGAFSNFVWPASMTFSGGGSVATIPTGRLSLTLGVTTTIYLSTNCGFSVSSLVAYGYLGARRVL
jgi:hypothetical protein